MSTPFDNYEVVIGLECHVQLLTKTKLFSPAKNNYGDRPNENVDIVDLGLPGVLPVINRKAIDFALRLGFALGCNIPNTSVFSRKHYFYPDLPKGYQISQYDQPICGEGSLEITLGNGQTKTIGIERIHIEEDAGKNIHVEGGNSSFIDYNRAGTPLLEVVTKPDFRSSEEAMAFYKTLRQLVTFLEICDGNMQEGSMRADANVSVRKKDTTTLGTRTETKNLNSIKFLGQACDFEKNRQILELEEGKSIVQETRLWDSAKKESRSLRTKEEADDYRYFPEPDLLPLIITDSEKEALRKTLPELPAEKNKRFITKLGVNEYNAKILTSDKEMSNYFEDALAVHNNAKGIANWIINDILRIMKTKNADDESINMADCPVVPKNLASLVKLIDEGHISGKIAKDVFEEMQKDYKQTPEQIVKEKGWKLEKDEGALKIAVEKVVTANASEVEKFKAGKDRVFGFLMGQIMKETKGKADPKDASKLLRERLQKA